MFKRVFTGINFLQNSSFIAKLFSFYTLLKEKNAFVMTKKHKDLVLDNYQVVVQYIIESGSTIGGGIFNQGFEISERETIENNMFHMSLVFLHSIYFKISHSNQIFFR